MQYDLQQSIQVLKKTPELLHLLLSGLDEVWTMNNEGPETFSPFDVVGHLIHGEKTDWPVRINMILEHGTSQPFERYDRFAMYQESKGKSMDDLLVEFSQLRKKNLFGLCELHLDESDFHKQGTHPVLGTVTLKQLLATWVVHDLSHMSQVTRVMAKQYKDEIGPWIQFFRILNW